MDFWEGFFGVGQKHGLELLHAEFVLLGIEYFGEAVSDDGEKVSCEEGELGDGESLVFEQAQRDVGIGVFQNRFCLGLVVQDGEVAGEGEVELLGIGAAYVSEGQVICRGG